MERRIWLNDKILPESRAKVSILDRGFLYGDGVYEAVRIYGGRIFRAEDHWRRLDRSLAGVRLSVPWSHEYLTRACLATADANRLREALVRTTISRGVGELGYDPRTCKKPTLTVIAIPVRPDLWRLWSRGVPAAIVRVRRNSIRSLNPAIKHTNSLNGVLAKMESLESGAFEGIFLNLEGYVAEGTISNVFLVKDGVFKTPALRCGILDGVTRRALIQVARAGGRKVVETLLRPRDLYAADEVFLTSTTMEAMPVARLDGKRIGDGKPGPWTRWLQEGFRRLVERELG